ncbi:MAG: FIST signal transduction protein [Lawsonibacter sp.]
MDSTPEAAGAQAAKEAKQGLSAIKLALVYGSADYDLKAMLEGVASEIPGVPLVGNTSFTGVITPKGYVSGEHGFIGVMAMSDENLSVGVAGSPRGNDPRKTGVSLAHEAMKSAGKTTAPDYFYMVASPAEEEYYLKGITEVIGRVPFFGGSAADNEIAGKWSIYTSDAIFPDGCAIVFFYTNGAFANEYTGAYHETDDVGIVTKMNGDRNIVAIDGVPALKKYADWRGMDITALKGANLLAASVVSPLGVKDRLGDLVAIRHPMNGNDDDTINVGNKIAEKTAVIRMETTVDELISSAGQTLGALKAKMPEKPAAYFLVHCGGRRAGIGDRIDEVANLLIKEADGVPFLCEFTFGEYGFVDDGRNTCGGLMLSFTGFGK